MINLKKNKNYFIKCMTWQKQFTWFSLRKKEYNV